MAATTEIHIFTGAFPGTNTNVTSTEVRFKRQDEYAASGGTAAQAPVPIPTSGTNYSWRKHFKLRVVTDPSNQISNLRFFSSGSSLGTGITHNVATTGTYVAGSSADETASIGGADSSTYTAGSPLVINSGQVMAAGAAPTFGTQDFTVQQMGVGTAAVAGVSGARTYTYRYDES